MRFFVQDLSSLLAPESFPFVAGTAIAIIGSKFRIFCVEALGGASVYSSSIKSAIVWSRLSGSDPDASGCVLRNCSYRSVYACLLLSLILFRSNSLRNTMSDEGSGERHWKYGLFTATKGVGVFGIDMFTEGPRAGWEMTDTYSCESSCVAGCAMLRWILYDGEGGACVRAVGFLLRVGDEDSILSLFWSSCCVIAGVGVVLNASCCAWGCGWFQI